MIQRSAYCLLLLLTLECLAAPPSAAADGGVDYLHDIKPILQERCYACHGALKQQAGLRLDTGAFARKGGDSGAALVPGKPEGSLLLTRVSAPALDERMPPEGEPLTPPQIAALKAWIAAGATSPADEPPETDPRQHWAFQPVVRPAVPSVKNAAWTGNPIDAFLAEKYEAAGLTPAAEAPRTILVRRLYLDLLGVPPTAEELSAVASDPRDDWYERLVNQLLADSRHGERWGRHWLDVWRYSDWWGLGTQMRNSQPHIWHWRDWTTEALNADLPYDEMVRQMLAGDELHPSDLSRLRATGFLARNYFLFNRNQWLDETVEHVGKSLLGITLNCAKCHDHKYDPFEQADFYRFRAFFEPYHVRMDMVPGEPDLTKDGIPRAFDGLPNDPTYLFTRGQESQPDKSQVIAPGLPQVIAYKPLAIAPVKLPDDAWRPERRAWVYETLAEGLNRDVAAAELALATAEKKLAAAQARAAKPPKAAEKPVAQGETATETTAPPVRAESRPDQPGFQEKFATLDPVRWKTFGGAWKHEPGRLSQQRDGAARSALRYLGEAPRDFDCTVRFTIHGGSKWRSVGLCFDSTLSDPLQQPAPSDSEQNVYLSAVAGGSKLQASYQQGGAWKYPADGLRALPVEIGREYTLRVQLRDTLVNAALDGKPLLAWRSPLSRKAGALQCITFDALATFHEISLAPLSSEVVLQEPSAAPAAVVALPPPTAEPSVDEATAEKAVASAALAVARAEKLSLEKRHAATLAAAEQSAALSAAAVTAERQSAVEKARHAVTQAELKLVRTAEDKREPVQKELTAASQTLAKAEKTAAAPVTEKDRFAPLVGAKWTATRFRSSGADDPNVPFLPESTGRRKALADWIAVPRNPLTARVAVNHIWLRHMGAPLAPSVFDLGRKSVPPTHPKLLDWLAAEFTSSGWSMKHLHRLIVTSAAYRLSTSSIGRDQEIAQDPDNLLYWRRHPQRLESQAVRDSVLALAGELDFRQGGPTIPAAQQAESRRRSLYFFHSNNERNLFLTTFDEAAVKECYRREQSIVPQQALALTNSRLVLESAGKIAAQVSRAAAADDLPASDPAFVRQAFLMLLGAPPTGAEAAATGKALAAWRGQTGQTAATAREQLIWVLLNHNDFVTLR